MPGTILDNLLTIQVTCMSHLTTVKMDIIYPCKIYNSYDFTINLLFSMIISNIFRDFDNKPTKGCFQEKLNSRESNMYMTNKKGKEKE